MKVAICKTCGKLSASPLWSAGTTKFNHLIGFPGHEVKIIDTKEK